MDSQVARLPPPLTPHHEKVEFIEAQSKRKVQNGIAASSYEKETSPVPNGRNQPWEKFTPEAFAQHFHQVVLQSTHGTLQSKGKPIGLHRE